MLHHVWDVEVLFVLHHVRDVAILTNSPNDIRHDEFLFKYMKSDF